MVWILFLVMIILALGFILLPLFWRESDRGLSRSASARSLYQVEIATIDKEYHQNLISENERDLVKAEAGRRILARLKSDEPFNLSTSRSRWTSVLLVIMIPACAFGLYYKYGQPNLSDKPLAERLDDPADIQMLVAKIEKRLQDNPKDGQGFALLAPVYMSLQEYEKAADAYGKAIELLGPTSERWADYGEALVYLSNGRVIPIALNAFDQSILGSNPSPKAFYYRGLFNEQQGKLEEAAASFQELLARSPSDAPWRPLVERQLQVVTGQLAQRPMGSAPQINVDSDKAQEVAAMPQADQQKFFHTMVDSLKARLGEESKDTQGWLRLIRSYTVLNEPDHAREALHNARNALKDDPVALKEVDTMANQLGIDGQ